jgi:hypothetical protein
MWDCPCCVDHEHCSKRVWDAPYSTWAYIKENVRFPILYMSIYQRECEMVPTLHEHRSKRVWDAPYSTWA